MKQQKRSQVYYNPQIHHRRSTRLKGYDYSQAGLYFVTICCQDGICCFGDIVDDESMPNEHGQIVQLVWDELPKHYANVQLGEFVVMPNHIHGIIAITDVGVVSDGTVGTGLKPAPTPAPTLACTIAAPTIPAAPRSQRTTGYRKLFVR